MKAHRNFVTGEVVLTLTAQEASNLADDIWELDGHVEFARFFASRAEDRQEQGALLTRVSNAVQFAQVEVEHETWDGRVPVPSKKGEDGKRHLRSLAEVLGETSAAFEAGLLPTVEELARTSSCQSCSKRPGREEHPCPYDEEMGAWEMRCNCCENCMGNCAAAI